MMFWLDDPGSCIVCGTAHCACTDDGGPIVIEQLPATAAAAVRAAHPLKADLVQRTLAPGQFTTGTYRRGKPSTAAPRPRLTNVASPPTTSQEPSPATDQESAAVRRDRLTQPQQADRTLK